jgi:hypothetical protein
VFIADGGAHHGCFGSAGGVVLRTTASTDRAAWRRPSSTDRRMSPSKTHQKYGTRAS